VAPGTPCRGRRPSRTAQAPMRRLGVKGQDTPLEQPPHYLSGLLPSTACLNPAAGTARSRRPASARRRRTAGC
jgi:hypothetical protein